jgi:hypothetical protein
LDQQPPFPLAATDIVPLIRNASRPKLLLSDTLLTGDQFADAVA